MLQKFLILTVLVVMLPATGFAQGMSQRERGDRACRGDVQRHCRPVMNQGDSVVLQCLQRNQNRISKACRRVLQENGVL